MLLPLSVAQLVALPKGPPPVVAQPPRMPLFRPAVVVTNVLVAVVTFSVPGVLRLMPFRASVRLPPAVVREMMACPTLTAVPPVTVWVTAVVAWPCRVRVPLDRVRAPLPSLLDVLAV